MATISKIYERQRWFDLYSAVCVCVSGESVHSAPISLVQEKSSISNELREHETDRWNKMMSLLFNELMAISLRASNEPRLRLTDRN